MNKLRSFFDKTNFRHETQLYIEQADPLNPSNDIQRRFNSFCSTSDHEESTVRYRKSRARLNGNERERWCEKNVVHSAAFEEDVESVNNNKDKVFMVYAPPGTNVVPHSNSKSEAELERQAIHFAALGGAVNTVELLASNNSLSISDGRLKPIHVAAQFGGLKSTCKSTSDARRLARACIKAYFDKADTEDEYNTTPLHYGCLTGNAPVVEELLQRKANVDAVQSITGMTPLMMAAQANAKEVILLLLKYDPDLTIIDTYGNTVLHFAVIGSDDPEIIKILIEAVPLMDRDKFVCQQDFVGVAALRLAVEENKLKVAEHLLRHYISHHNHEHEQLMVHLATQRRNSKMVALLCENGWPTEIRDKLGQTPLHLAAIFNEVSLVRQLLNLSANVEARDDAGFTPLLVAAAYDSVDVIKYLLIKNKSQLTALTYVGENLALIAVRRNAVKTIKYLYGSRDVTTDRLKVTLTSLLTQPDLFRDTTLHHAASNGNLAILNVILPYFSNINLRNDEFKTPLHIAAQCNRVEIARSLLRISVASINLADKDNATPLFLAVSKSSIQMIQVLLANGADPMTKVEGCKIPLDIAIRDGNLEVVQLLLDEINGDEDQNRRVYPLHDAVRKKQAKILRMLLEKEYTPIDQVDERNYTCLDLAIERQYIEAIQVILEHPDVLKLLRRRVPSGQWPEKSPIQNLILKIPHMVKPFLDKCVVQWSDYCMHVYMYLDDTYYIPIKNDPMTMENFNDPIFETCVSQCDPHLHKDAVERSSSYKTLLDDHPITLMLNSRLYDLLAHPIVESYITMKWNTTKKFYYSLMSLQALFVGCLTAITININPNTIDEYSVKYQCLTGEAIPYANYWLLIFAFLQWLLGMTKSFRDGKFKGAIEFALVAFTVLISYPVCHNLDSRWQWSFIVLLNFSVWINLINYVRRVPRFGVYVLMISHTCRSFIRFSPVFFIILAPFIVTFHVLLGNSRGVVPFLKTAIKTVVMMTGEYDYTDTVGNKGDALTYLMFLLFLFIGTVFLMNLLVGLAVSDTEKTLEKATRTRIRLQVATIQHVEIIFSDTIRRRVWKGFKKFKTNDNCERIFKYDEASCSDIWKIWNSFGMSKKVMQKEKSNCSDAPSLPASSSSEEAHGYSCGAQTRYEAELIEIRKQLVNLTKIQTSLNELIERSKHQFVNVSREDIGNEEEEEEDYAMYQSSGNLNPEQLMY